MSIARTAVPLRRPKTPFYTGSTGEIVFAAVDGLFVQCVNSERLTDEVWIECCELVSQFYREQAPFVVQLLFIPGAGPNTRQRSISKRYEKAWSGLENVRRIAMLTDSALVRGAVTAISWLIFQERLTLRAFPCRNHASAISWLAELDAFAPDAAAQLLREVTARAGIPELP